MGEKHPIDPEELETEGSLEIDELDAMSAAGTDVNMNCMNCTCPLDPYPV